MRSAQVRTPEEFAAFLLRVPPNMPIVNGDVTKWPAKWATQTLAESKIAHDGLTLAEREERGRSAEAHFALEGYRAIRLRANCLNYCGCPADSRGDTAWLPCSKRCGTKALAHDPKASARLACTISSNAARRAYQRFAASTKSVHTATACAASASPTSWAARMITRSHGPRQTPQPQLAQCSNGHSERGFLFYAAGAFAPHLEKSRAIRRWSASGLTFGPDPRRAPDLVALA